MDYRQRIKALRKENKETQVELAKVCGTTDGNIGHWENLRGDVPIDALIKICKHYKVTSDYILGLSQERQPQKTVRKSPIYRMPIPTATKTEQPPKRINNAPPEYISTPQNAETKPIIAANSIPQPKKKK